MCQWEVVVRLAVGGGGARGLEEESEWRKVEKPGGTTNGKRLPLSSSFLYYTIIHL